MYAIVDIAGQQMKVENGMEVFSHRLEGNPGDKVEFEKVLLTDDGGKVKIGECKISVPKPLPKSASRHQKEKRLRPQRDPYVRDHFDQSKYLRISIPNKPNLDSSNNEDHNYSDIADEFDYDELE